MLDLIFLVLFLIIIIRSLSGHYNETLCNVAMVIGILAAIVGIFSNIFANLNNSNKMVFLNILVLGIAIGQRFVARYFARLYNEKVEQSRRNLEKDIEMHSRKRDGSDYQIAEADFDNEEIRFGKGGFKAYDEDYTVDDITLNDKK